MKNLIIRSIVKYFTISLFCMLPNVLLAQSDIADIVANLKKVEVFKECERFKNELEYKTKELASKPHLTEVQRNELRSAYNGVYEKYDIFVATVKKSLLDKNKLQSIFKNPDEASRNYMTLYQGIKEEHELSYLPVYKRLNAGSKLIMDELLQVGIKIFNQLIEVIKERKIKKNENFNTLLQDIDANFFKNLRLKSWAELDISIDSQSLSNPNQAVASQNEQVTKQGIILPESILSEMVGSIEFVQNSDGKQVPILFKQSQGKGTEVINDKDSPVQFLDKNWVSAQSYSIGTKFKIKVSNSAFTYFIVLNPEGAEQLYPKLAKNSKSTGVEYDITPTIGDLTLPSEDASFVITVDQPGSITKAEEFCILVSRSELVSVDILQRLNTAKGSLSERISQVFGEERVNFSESTIESLDSKIVFEATGSKAKVLPIVFKINKSL